ncbi:uncharacterized PurR-regulated membrane protein YhhQ (DUF165 family) [Paenibacillus sp. LBL]|uniref:VUT family protein n=1 Tax=Paenibacillus sp. LBL TaxID=2940563 RepID=UPI002474BA67|nr:VUT family protein [Paenibacillus sp. LBL]MDH6674287.1 uncharacterized PurR-regulated membrane protein YhhQ (DUF165 family) [Paenibacillus sp. LBL]
MRVLFYMLSIIAANIITAKIAPLNLGLFIVPTGTLLIGLTFILRDLVQMRHGRKQTYKIISFALIASALTSYLLGDTLWIVFASTIAFIVSETTDTEIFTRLKTSLTKRVMWSGVIGGTLDSAIFAVIGLSPLGANFLTWSEIWLAIIGQVIVKIVMQMFGSTILKYLSKGGEH